MLGNKAIFCQDFFNYVLKGIRIRAETRAPLTIILTIVLLN